MSTAAHHDHPAHSPYMCLPEVITQLAFTCCSLKLRIFLNPQCSSHLHAMQVWAVGGLCPLPRSYFRVIGRNRPGHAPWHSGHSFLGNQHHLCMLLSCSSSVKALKVSQHAATKCVHQVHAVYAMHADCSLAMLQPVHTRQCSSGRLSCTYLPGTKCNS